MQVVIEIPDAFYEIFNSIDLSNKHWDEKYYVYGIAYSLLVGLQDGQPLPKGHGDLIDKSKLVPDCYELEIHDGEDWRNAYCGVSLMQIEECTEVIVKADEGDAK